MKPSPLTVALISLALISTACTPESGIATKTAPALQPVVDSAPYICKLVPEDAFRLLTAATRPPVEKMSGNKDSGDCFAPDATPPALEVGWLRVGAGTSQEHMDLLMDSRRDLYTRHDGVPLPADLGEGMAAHVTNSPLDSQPYRVSAKFQCGSKDRMIDIYLPQVAKGRDAIKDMIELMRIAQKRYSKLYNCTLDA
ncbi:hypothetical protein GBF35_11645 [Nonomuraea phyllanthi]|uniref:hypothetical protein n=1 Tax=Nonomuraea phyllanthi TaxID=2219224 RepID=UPI0012936ED6|nr:hypothetical protein [Nonomuraea phyllanthi]QFY07255.1 hypothetical protein GBF35_11645 [Nonomuraea phyllanthi]